MKYKVGDKVKVRKDLKINKKYGNQTFVEEMDWLRGMTATINQTLCDSIYILEEDGIWCWTDEMFEDIKENKMKYKIGDKVRVRKDLKVGKLYGDLMLYANMETIGGQIVTINEITTHGNYGIDESAWYYSEEMLEDLKEENKMSKLEDLELKYKELGEEIEKLKKKEKSKVWKPEDDEEYWYITSDDCISSCTWDNWEFENAIYLIGNCFKTKEEAEKASEKIKIYTELKRYAEEHNGEFGEYRYCIAYAADANKVTTDFDYNFRDIGQIFFSNREIAKQAIEKIGEEKLKKLFE